MSAIRRAVPTAGAVRRGDAASPSPAALSLRKGGASARPLPAPDSRQGDDGYCVVTSWRSLKHQWLYLNPLESLQDVRRLVAFYVDSHNGEMPHSAFQGQTPDEMYFGTPEVIPEQLALAREAARKSRLEMNRQLGCETCAGDLGDLRRVEHTAA